MRRHPEEPEGEESARIGEALKRAYPPDTSADATIDQLIDRLNSLVGSEKS